MNSQQAQKSSRKTRSTVYLIAQAASTIRNAWIDPTLKEYGLTSLQYTILSVINRRSGLSSAELSRLFFVTPQTIGPILTQLEKRDLLVREENPGNRRLLAIKLTELGRQYLESSDLKIEKIERTIFGDMSEAELQRFRQTLLAVTQRSTSGSWQEQEREEAADLN